MIPQERRDVSFAALIHAGSASRRSRDVYRRTGKREEARNHLTTATTMYREMDMRFWLEQAEAELGERS
jgi:hypothetical protein